MAKSKLPLAELLAQVAADVRTANARARAAEGGPVMKFAECELELAVDAETTGDGKVELWVVSLGGGHTRSESHTIKIKYTADQNNPQGAVGALPPSEIQPPTRPKKRGGK